MWSRGQTRKAIALAITAVVLMQAGEAQSAVDAQTQFTRQSVEPAKHFAAAMSIPSASFLVAQASDGSEGDGTRDHDLSGVIVDVEKGQVFVPEQGWIDPQLFYDYYLESGAGTAGGMSAEELAKLQEALAQK